MDEVVKDESTFSSGSVGIFEMILRKKESPKYWNNLIKEGTKFQGNVKQWFEIRERFIDELQVHIDEQERQVS